MDRPSRHSRRCPAMARSPRARRESAASEGRLLARRLVVVVDRIVGAKLPRWRARAPPRARMNCGEGQVMDIDPSKPIEVTTVLLGRRVGAVPGGRGVSV